jgi:hypothetical protein
VWGQDAVDLGCYVLLILDKLLDFLLLQGGYGGSHLGGSCSQELHSDSKRYRLVVSNRIDMTQVDRDGGGLIVRVMEGEVVSRSWCGVNEVVQIRVL